MRFLRQRSNAGEKCNHAIRDLQAQSLRRFLPGTRRQGENLFVNGRALCYVVRRNFTLWNGGVQVQSALMLILAAMLSSCAGARHSQRRGEEARTKVAEPETKSTEKPPPAVVVVTSNLDAKPLPVGGAAAIQAAMQEPEEVWKENKTGTTVVEARVTAQGKIAGTKVHKSSGYAGMDAEAMLAVSRVRWKPGRRNNKPVESVVRVTIEFNTTFSSKY